VGGLPTGAGALDGGVSGRERTVEYAVVWKDGRSWAGRKTHMGFF